MDHRAGPEAGVIVVAGRDGPRLERCLSAVAETATDVEAQVVVVLNGAAPDACAVAREHPRADVVVECPSTVGFAAAANLGRRHAAAPRLVFLDDGTMVHPGTIRRLLAVLGEHPRAGACGPMILGSDGRVRAAGPVLFADGRSGAPASGEARRSDFCRSCALAVRTEAFDDAGGFEEAYFPGDFTAADLGLAFRRTGWEVWFEPSVSVVHDDQLEAQLSVGFRAFCHRHNRTIFLEKWREDLAELEPFDEHDVEGSVARATARATEREPRRLERAPGPVTDPVDEAWMLRAYVQHLEHTGSAANGSAERRRAELAEELETTHSAVAHAKSEIAVAGRELAALTDELRRTHAAYAELEQHRSALADRLVALDGHVRESAAANERLTAEVERLRGRERELEAILSGGWWRLRGRVDPALRLARRVGPH